LSVNVETFGTGLIADERIAELILDQFDLRPGAIIRDLDLRRPIYRQTAAYGHFGRDDLDLPWEQTNKAEALRQAAGLELEAAALAD
jgi:S-adenosylmethionine synthetase